MSYFLTANGANDDAYVQKTFPSDTTYIIDFDLYMPYATGNNRGNADVIQMFGGATGLWPNPTNNWHTDGGSSGGSPPVYDSWVPVHIVAGSLGGGSWNIDYYVNSELVIAGEVITQDSLVFKFGAIFVSGKPQELYMIRNVVVTGSGSVVLFSDDFSSGTLSAWDSQSGQLTLDQSLPIPAPISISPTQYAVFTDNYYLTQTVAASSVHKFEFYTRIPADTFTEVGAVSGHQTAKFFTIQDGDDEIFSTFANGALANRWAWWTEYAGSTGGEFPADTWVKITAIATHTSSTHWDVEWLYNDLSIFIDTNVNLEVDNTEDISFNVGSRFGTGTYHIYGVSVKDSSDSTVFSDDFSSMDFSSWDSADGDGSGTVEALVNSTTPGWLMKLYDINGNPIDVVPFTSTHGSTNTIWNAKNRQIELNINGIDTLSFDLLLTDPMSSQINRLTTNVAVWRTVYDPIAGKFLANESDRPFFKGVVSYTNKQGQANTMSVQVQSALWRLQSHFHIDNHYLDINPDTSEQYSVSELMWKLIDLINNAFGVSSYTGIDEGTFHWGLDAGEPTICPFFVPRGSNTWSNIFDTIMTTSTTGVDIIPEYFHIDGNSTTMLLNTDEVRGQDRTETTKLNYHTDPGGDPPYLPNCDDMTEEQAPQPSTGSQDAGFANYVWVVGQGGVNSGKVAIAQNSDSTPGSNGFNELGIYMALVSQDSLKTFPQVSGQAPTELAIRTVPKTTYGLSVAPGGRMYYGVDFELGDVVALNANKGALQLDDVAQRIYQATLTLSDNNIERCALQVSNDYTGKIPLGE